MIDPTTTERYSDAANALCKSRQAIEALIDSTAKDDHFTIGLLGQSLADLRSALATIEQLSQSPNNA